MMARPATAALAGHPSAALLQMESIDAMEYLTADDKARLEQKLKELTARRKELSDRIGRARELGDLRENAEYHSAKDEQGLNEAKIRQLEERLATSVVADTDTLPDDMVVIGTIVTLRDTSSEQEELYKLVGEPSDDYDAEYIEVTPNSVLGQALMKARVGEVVRVDLPRGERNFEIVGIVR